MRRDNTAKIEAECLAFNARYPVGTDCIVWKGAKAGDGIRTKTRSEARVLSGHTAVVWVEGVSGCISLTHVDMIVDGIRTIPALSLLQPWASLVDVSAKLYETRSWRTEYRGPLAIHASKGFARENRDLCRLVPFRSALLPHFGNGRGDLSVTRLPLGSVLCIVDLVDCMLTEDIRGSLSPRELAFGDYSAGRWVWKLANVRRLRDPQVVSGALGIWKWETAESSLVFAGGTHA